MEKTRCQLEREHILGAAGAADPPRPGLFVPECDEHGHYVPTQCHGSTGYCWCVDRDGRELEGTRTRPGMRPPCKCEGSAVLGLCLRRAWGSSVSDSRLVAEGACAVGPLGHSPCSGGLAFQCLWRWDIEGLGEADRSPSLGGTGQGVGACVQPSGAVRLGTQMASVSASSASTQQRSRTVSWMDPGSKILPLSQT